MVFDRVLVTGGAGFIGSHLVGRLAGMGCEVFVVDNLFTGKVENLQRFSSGGKFRFFDGDVRDKELVGDLVGKVDGVVHLAAISSVPFSVENPVLTNEVNVEGTLNLLYSSVKGGVRRFVFTSSCAVYGEPLYLPIDEKHPVEPLSPYAASKVAAEAYCRAFRAVYGLETVVLRLFNVYGAGQRVEDGYSGVITAFAKNLMFGKSLIIYGDGCQTRDFVYVEDVVDAILLALEKEEAVGETFNVGSGRETSVNDLARVLMGIFGVEVEMVYEKARAGDLRRSLADVSKMEKVLGYRPLTRLEEGLERFVDEFKKDFS